MARPRLSGKDYIAQIWGNRQDKKVLLLAAEGKPVSEFLMEMVRARYAELFGDAPPDTLMPDDQIPERYQSQFDKMKRVEDRNAWRKERSS